MMSLLLEGEPGGEAYPGVREHLAACADCARRFRLLGEVVGELSRLPRVLPDPTETERLFLRLREAYSLTAPRPPAARSMRPAVRWVAVAASLAVLAVAVTSWALVDGRRAAPPVIESVEGQGPAGVPAREAGVEASTLSLQDIYPSNAEELAVRPVLVLSGREYSTADLHSYSEDIGQRMAFYSAYWYPIAGDTRSPYLSRLQGQLVDDLARQAQQAGLNPEELRGALASVLGGEERALLPCRAELVRLEGKEAWLFSLSGPEDYLLFPDPQVPAALSLAARGGEESLKLSQSLLQELAAYLLPRGQAVSATGLDDVDAAEAAGSPGETDGAGREPAATGEEASEKESEREFQAFLREMAARGNPAEVLAALRELNYQQLLLLLQGDWTSLASRGVDLSEFLLPPRRLVAVDRAGGRLLWGNP